MTYDVLLKWAYKKAVEHNKEEEAVKLLLMELSDQEPSQFFLNLKNEVEPKLEVVFKQKLEQYLINDIPVQHLIGYSYFFGHKIRVNSDVLIPRGETEQLVEHILYYYDTYFSDKDLQVLDLGTGSGCIGLALALEEKKMNLTISDLSFDALRVATYNRDHLGAKAQIVQSDLFKNIKGTFDIIVSNPPYIPDNEQVQTIVEKEPCIALFGGEYGIDFYEKILCEAPKYLKKKALIAFEHGFQQKQKIYDLAKKHFPQAVIIQKRDLAQKDRFTFIGINGILDMEKA